jgi:hypothetical protein
MEQCRNLRKCPEEWDKTLTETLQGWRGDSGARGDLSHPTQHISVT